MKAWHVSHGMHAQYIHFYTIFFAFYLNLMENNWWKEGFFAWNLWIKFLIFVSNFQKTNPEIVHKHLNVGRSTQIRFLNIFSNNELKR